MMQVLQAVGQLFLRTLYYFYLVPFREAFLNLKELPKPQRTLAIVGYSVTGALLIFLLVVELWGGGMGQVTFTRSDGSEMRQIPLAVIIVSMAAMALGWAFLLTGASDGHPIVFIPIAVVFGIQLMCVIPFENTPALIAWCCSAPTLILAAAGAHIFTHKKPVWKELQVGEFLIWAAAGVFFLGLWGFTRGGLDLMAQDLDGIYSLVMLSFIPIWMLAGMAVVDAAVDLGRRFIKLIREKLSDETLLALTVFLIITRPVITVALFIIDQINGTQITLQENPLKTALVLDGIFSVPLLIALVIVRLSKHWNARSAAVLLGTSVATPAFTLGLAMALLGQNIFDPFEMTASSLGLMPSLLVFVALVVHTTLSMGTRFAEKGGKFLPRSGRIMFIFGMVLGLLSFTLFFVNTRSAETGLLDRQIQDGINIFFSLSVFLFGGPYLLWMLIRHRERLAGPAEDYVPRPAAVEGQTAPRKQQWLTIATVSAVILLSLACGLALLFNQ